MVWTSATSTSDLLYNVLGTDTLPASLVRDDRTVITWRLDLRGHGRPCICSLSREPQSSCMWRCGENQIRPEERIYAPICQGPLEQNRQEKPHASSTGHQGVNFVECTTTIVSGFVYILHSDVPDSFTIALRGIDASRWLGCSVPKAP